MRNFDSLTRNYGIGAAQLFAGLAAPADRGGHAGLNRYLHDLYLRRPDLRAAYPDLDGEGALRFVDWAYRHGAAGSAGETPIPPHLLPTAWLSAPARRGAEAGVNRYLEELHARRPDLQRGFPDIANGDGARYVEWARSEGVKHDPVLRATLAAEMAEPSAVRRRGRVGDPGLARGVNLHGFLRAVLGVGEAARLVIGALDAAGIPLLPVDQPAARGREEHRFATVDGSEAGFDVNLMCLNPAQHWRLLRDRPESCVPGRRTIGFWWWELADLLPVEWRVGFGLVDEVWVGSEHAATAVRRYAPVPVVKVTIPVEPAPAPGLSRAELGLPEGFLFLTVFDYDSGLERKNPLAAIRAFASAFEPGSGAALVVKSINADRHPGDRRRLAREAARHPDIHLIDRYASRAEKDALIAACDCYVSLHRAEGFGLPLAEAMYLGRPTIATAYSGNLEFMTAANSHLVGYRPVAVGPDAGAAYYPAAGVWAEPDVAHAARLMRASFERPGDARRRGRVAAADIRRDFSRTAAARTMTARLEEIWRDAPEPPPSDRGRRLLERAAELAAARVLAFGP